MSIGKDSIQKRVAKEVPVETVEKVAETAPVAEKKAPTKKAPAKKAPATTAAPKKAPAKKTPAAKKPAAKPATAVMGNVSPEVVKKVTGNKENTANAFKRVALTEEMPYYLL